MRIVVDAMGSDNYPGPDVAGAVMAAREFGDEIIIVGDETRIQAELKSLDTAGLPLQVRHAAQVIEMTDKPSEIVRGKRDSSMHLGMELLRAGQADAFVTAGNTGAALAIAILHAPRRIRGVQRPALGVMIPVANFPLLIDNGANADCKPEYLLQFAHMGSLYMARARGIQQPRVGLISNGEEEGKGNELIQAATPLLQTSGLNYVGNVEPKEFMQGAVDVGVTDGFTGNILMKTTEAIAKALLEALRSEIMAATRTKLGGLLAKPAFDRVRARLNPDEIGGAVLLGVDGVVIIAHGRSNAYAMKQAIGQARRAVSNHIVDAIKEGLGRETAPDTATDAAAA